MRPHNSSQSITVSKILHFFFYSRNTTEQHYSLAVNINCKLMATSEHGSLHWATFNYVNCRHVSLPSSGSPAS